MRPGPKVAGGRNLRPDNAPVVFIPLLADELQSLHARQQASDVRYGCDHAVADGRAGQSLRMGAAQNAQDVVRELTGKYEVFVVTAAMEVPCSFVAKFDWLQRHFPFIPTSHIVFCGDKSIIAADYLIDDNVRQLSRFHGQGIIFTAPHNVNETRFPRVESWEDVRRKFLGPDSNSDA